MNKVRLGLTRSAKSITVIAAFLLCACKPDPTFQQTFNSALSIGDLIKVDIDTAALKLDYNVIEGDLKGRQGVLTLKPNALLPGKLFSGNDPQSSDSIPVLAIHDEVIIGMVNKDLYVGVPSRQTPYSLADIEGIYNVVAYFPKGALDIKTGTFSPFINSVDGTVKIATDGKWQFVPNENLAQTDINPRLWGTLNDQGNGILELTLDPTLPADLLKNGTKLGNAMIRINSSKQHFMVIDLALRDAFKGIGFGQRHVEKSLEPGIADGLYVALSVGHAPERALVKGTKLDVVTDAGRQPFTLTYDQPWQGLIKGAGPASSDFQGFYSSGSKVFYGVLKTANHTRAFIAASP